MAAVTRLSQLAGIGFTNYGTFSPKAPNTAAQPHNPGIITRLSQLGGIGFTKYGTFQPKGAAPIVVTTTVDAGIHGPGFNLFYPPRAPRRDRRDEVEEVIRRILDLADNAANKTERRAATKELKQTVSEFVARPDLEIELQKLAESLKVIDAMKLTLREYANSVAQAVADWEAEQDDLLAIQIIMEML